MTLFKKDIFGNFHLTKRILYVLIGTIAIYRFKRLYKTRVEGTEILKKLPDSGVLFISNHQTYFADVAMMFLVFASVRAGNDNKLGSWFCLFRPKLNSYFVAAMETMKSGFLPKLFTYGGGILIKRTWRESGKNINRQVDLRDITKINEGLKDGWVVTFPQGTTTPYKAGRKGTVHIIKTNDPIVVPVVIDGFRRAFDKKGLKIKKRGTQLSIRFKEPIQLDYNKENPVLLQEIMDAIEQSEDYKPVTMMPDNGD